MHRRPPKSPRMDRLVPYLPRFQYLAWGGGAIAYVPFLTIWLPSRMTELAGPADVQTLGYVTFFGAIAASAGDIIFGWFSDRTHSRRAWVFAGLVLSVTLLMLVRSEEPPSELQSLMRISSAVFCLKQ